MPKYRGKKKPPGPYDNSRKLINATEKEKTTQGSDHGDDTLGCDSCKAADPESLIQCEKCLLWMCCDCQSISPSMFKALTEFQSLHWYCSKCESLVQEMLKASQEGETTKNLSVEGRLLSMERQLAEMASSINKLSVSSNLPTNGLAAKAVSTPESVHSDQFALKIVDEYRDQERRKLNLIFHKIPESHSKDVTQRREHDKKFALNVVKEIGVDDPDIVVATRLGQFNESRVRLLKVEVRNLTLKRSILSNAKKLRNANSEQFRKIYITPDLSYQERMHQKNLRSELQRRKEAGEFNLVIRRGQIVTASRVAADMDHSPSLLTQNSSSVPVPSGNDQSG